MTVLNKVSLKILAMIIALMWELLFIVIAGTGGDLLNFLTSNNIQRKSNLVLIFSSEHGYLVEKIVNCSSAIMNYLPVS